MNIPSFNEAEIPKEKITAYLLCPEHPEGGSKARFFLSRGFSNEYWAELSEALRQQAVSGGVASKEEGRFGTKYIVDGTISCPDGSNPLIRTVWISVSSKHRPRLVTAHPLS